MQNNNIYFVVDLHGANENRNFGVALGTMHGKSCSTWEKQIIIGVFEKYGISEAGNGFARLDIDDQLPGEGDDHREPIIRYCHSISMPAAQLEINAKLRIPIRRDDATHHDVHFSGDQELITVLIVALSDIVASLAER